MPGRNPPSAHRLRELRRRGDVSVSALTTRTTALLFATLGLVIAAPALATELSELARAAWSADHGTSPDTLTPHLLHLLGWFVFPLLAGFGGALLGGLMQTRFNLAPAALGGRRSPFDLAGRLRERVSLRQLAPRLLSWLVAASLIVSCGAIVLAIADALLGWGGASGSELLEALMRATRVLAGVMLGSMAVLAMLELWMARRLYLRAHGMTDAELKREQRLLRGAPERRQEQRRRACEMARMQHVEEGDHAVLLIAPRQELAVMIAYRPPAVRTPCVAAMGQGERYRELIAASAVPVVEVPDLARALAREVSPGSAVPVTHHEALVDVMLESGISSQGAGTSS